MLWTWAVIAVLLSGCSSAGYYAQSVKGQVEIWRKSRPIETVLVDPGVSNDVKAKLNLALAIRQFAVEQMDLPDNGSYTEYVDLQRPYVVWSVFVAPELSLQPREWCFLVVGCVTYRGYFHKASALDFAQQFSDQGYDAYVGGVPAYSTLGWFDDPVPNTILGYPDEDFAGLIFHELAHQVAFAKGDTVFNESFATSVERVGVERWLEASGEPDRIVDYRLRQQRDQIVVQTILEYRRHLNDVYAANIADAEKRRLKHELLLGMKQAYLQAIGDWPNYTGYQRWFAGPINNAKLISIATYNDLVPAFDRLLAKHDGNLSAFYESARRLAAQSKEERRTVLSAL